MAAWRHDISSVAKREESSESGMAKAA